jgi:predicted ester cyclase
MDEQANLELIRSAAAALNSGDVDGYLECFSPSSMRWIAGFDDPVDLDDVGGHLRQLVNAFDPLRLDEELLIGEDRFVCARWQLRGVQVDDFVGVASHVKRINVATCEIYEILEGRVETSWVYQDPNQMFAQMTAERSAHSNK